MCVRRRYNSNGTLMFLATDNDTLELFRRNPDGTHSHLHTIVRHKDDIEDCDIALDDSCTRFSYFQAQTFVCTYTYSIPSCVPHRRGHSFSGRHGCVHHAQHLMTEDRHGDG
jgi:hypothetical protein